VAVPSLHLVVVPLGFPVRAADAYAWWDDDGGPAGPPIDEVLAAAAAGDVGAVAATMFDDLEGPVARRHPEVEAAKERLVGAGAVGALMSGSGPTVFGLARDEEHARAIAGSLGPPALVTRTLDGSPGPG
jgi:4-diphosphocytidyl-2-C-methyl-D-erythritol kinase